MHPEPPTARSRRARLIASLGLSILLLAALEGAHSLTGRGSLYRILSSRLSGEAALPSVSPTRWMPLTDEEREAHRETGSLGLYQAHVDPRVGYSFRANSELSILGVPFRTDALGLRKSPERSAPATSDTPLRIVLLGASIPFGFGLRDEQAPAQVLERLLNEHRVHGSRLVECRTVAVPRWSHRNAIHFLIDHWDELRADLVIYMPVGNDVSDTMVIDQSGHRRAWPDLTSRHPGIEIGDSAVMQTILYAGKRLSAAGALPSREFGGSFALRTGIGRESARRYDDAASSVERLMAHLDAQQAQLLVARYTVNDQMDVLFDTLARRGLRPEVLTLFDEVTPAMTLGDDPHPNAETQVSLAQLIAHALEERAWVNLDPETPLPAPHGAAAQELSAALDWEAVGPRAEEVRKLAREQLRATIVPETAEGLAQIYGGMSPEGLVGPGLLALLALKGPRVQLEIAPLKERAELYPLEISVSAEGLPLGRVTLHSERPLRAEFDLPPELLNAPFADLSLRASTWAVVRRNGRSLNAAFQLERLACPAP